MGNKLPSWATTSTQPKSSSPLGVSDISQRSSIYSNPFQGRLNRSGYLAGLFLLGFGIWIVSTMLTLVFVIFLGSEVAFKIILSLSAVIATFFSISLTIRRLHDLNKSGFLILALSPIYIFALLSWGISAMGLKSQFTVFLPYLDIPYRLVALISECYLLLWPGSKTENKYGKPSTHWTWQEILGFAAPQPKTPASTNSVVSKTPKLTKIMLVMILGMILFILSLIVLAFGIDFIRSFFQI
jgi:uncharacterized membrane protein YhaH (DUF805 family)